MCTTFLTSWVDKDPRRAFLGCLFPWPYLLNSWQLYRFCLYQRYWLPLNWLICTMISVIHDNSPNYGVLHYLFRIRQVPSDRAAELSLLVACLLLRAEPLYHCTGARGWGSAFPGVRFTFYKWSWGKMVAAPGLLLVNMEFQPYEWAGRRATIKASVF